MENKFTDYYRIGGIAGMKSGERQYINDIQRSLCVNPKSKLVYYKPGKCAGTSIFRHILQPMGGWIVQKDNPNEWYEWMDNVTDEQIKGYFSFIFVRNPFSRLVSAWNDTLRPEGHTDFKKFVKEKVFEDGIPTQLHFQTQSSLVETPDASVSNLNFIGKVENINADWERMCNLANILYKPMVHVKQKRNEYGHYTEHYDDETIELVSNLYQRDLEVFNYKFGD